MISILMPIYNGIEFISESVGSVINQIYTEWELIIGINGHEKNSEVYREALKYESDKIKIYDMNTKGKVNTLNEMVKYCKYNWIALLDVDDIWLPNKLEIQSSYLYKYDVIGTKCVYFGDINGNVPDIPVGDLSEIPFLLGNPMINSSVLIRKEYCHWEENGIEDYELWLRLKYQGRTFFNCQDVLVRHRIHSNSAFNSKGQHKDKGKELIEYYSNLYSEHRFVV